MCRDSRVQVVDRHLRVCCVLLNVYIELQKYYESIQALACNEEELEYDETHDSTLPDEAGFAQEDVRVDFKFKPHVMRRLLFCEVRNWEIQRSLRSNVRHCGEQTKDRTYTFPRLVITRFIVQVCVEDEGDAHETHQTNRFHR